VSQREPPAGGPRGRALGQRPPSWPGSALERDEAPERRIGETVLSSLDVTRKPALEIGVSANRDYEVVPSVELVQRHLVRKASVRLEMPRARVAGIGVEHGDVRGEGGSVLYSQLD